MFSRKWISAIAALALTSAPVLAQTTAPVAPRPAAPAAAPAAPKPAAAPAQPMAKKVNLNTANADELDKLPQIGPARAKAIVEARAKGKFKDWADFQKRGVVPSNAEAAIKDLVTF